MHTETHTHTTHTQGVDANSNNVVGAAKTKLGGVDCYSVIRIETDAQALAVKVTVKTNKPAMSDACASAVMLVLQGSAA